MLNFGFLKKIFQKIIGFGTNVIKKIKNLATNMLLGLRSVKNEPEHDKT